LSNCDIFRKQKNHKRTQQKMAQQWVVNDRMYLQGEILVSVPNPQKTVPLGFSSHSRAFFVVLRAAATKIRQLVNSLIHTFFAMFQATPSPKTTRDINVESQSPINLSQNSGTSPYSPQKLKVELDEEDYKDEEDEISSRQDYDWKQVLEKKRKPC
jgi:hypothetical protein